MNNYVVKSENITDGKKGLLKYVLYLNDKEHKHHLETSEIIEAINNKNNFFNYARAKADNAELKNMMAKKGGKPISNFAKSLTLNFPPSIKHPAEPMKVRKVLSSVVNDIYQFINQPPLPPREPKVSEIEAPEKWQNYAKNKKQYEKELKAFIPIDLEEFKKSVYAVWHHQNNEHIHLTLSSYIDKKNIRAYKLKSFVSMVKKSFTIATDKEFGIDISMHHKTTNKSYTKKEVLKDKATTHKTVRVLRALVKRLIDKYPQDENFLNKVVADLDKGHTDKANKKLEKFGLNNEGVTI